MSGDASSVFNRGLFFFFFKQKTAYEMRISDWSSDVCSSDLVGRQADIGEGAFDDIANPFLADSRDDQRQIDDLGERERFVAIEQRIALGPDERDRLGERRAEDEVRGIDVERPDRKSVV